jgi:sugar/nucleoside kinase (ribokinase family)
VPGFDVVGVGALNLDYIDGVSAQRQRDPGMRPEIVTRFELGVETPVDEATILDALDRLGGREALVPSLGGSAFLTIHALAEMGLGLRLGYIGVAGRSPAPDFSPLQLMDDLGIDHSVIRLENDRTTGICVSHLRQGERTLLTWPGANLGFATYVDDEFEVLASYLASTRFIHVTSLLDPVSPGRMLALLTEAKRRNPEVKLVFDPGYTWCAEQPDGARKLLGITDYLLVNYREFQALGGLEEHASDDDMAEAVLGRCGPKCAALVAKQYDRVLEFRPLDGGVLREEYEQRPLEPDTIEDATGAGDVFAAGLLAALASPRLQFELGAFLGLRMARHKLRSVGDRGYAEFASLARGFLRDWGHLLVSGEREAG